jgi:hypothetical protein
LIVSACIYQKKLQALEVEAKSDVLIQTLVQCLDLTDVHLALSFLWKEHFDPEVNQKTYEGVGTNFKIEMLDSYMKMMISEVYEKVLDDQRLKIDKIFPIRCSELKTFKGNKSLI